MAPSDFKIMVTQSIGDVFVSLLNNNHYFITEDGRYKMSSTVGFFSGKQLILLI